jgi:hypothetical protein
MTDGKWILTIVFAYILSLIISLISSYYENMDIPPISLMSFAIYTILVVRFKITFEEVVN